MIKNPVKSLSLKALFIFSVPSILGSVIAPIAGIVDTAFVGHLSSSWLASLGLAIGILNAMIWMSNFIVHSTTKSAADGKNLNDLSILLERIKISNIVSLSIGIVLSGILYIFRYKIYVFAGASSLLIEDLDKYFTIRLIGIPFELLTISALSVLKGIGKVKLSFYLFFTAVIFNITLTYYLLFIIKTDLTGAAIATVISLIYAAILSMYFSFKEVSKKVKLNYSFPKSKEWFNFGVDSFNLFLRSLFLTSSFILSNKLVASVGVKSLAAHQVLLQLWLLYSFITDGIALSGNILVARYFGQGKIERTRLVIIQILKLGIISGVIVTIIYYLLSDSLISIFTFDIKVIKIVKEIWFLLVMAPVVSSIAFLCDGLIFGLGRFDYLRKHMIIAVVVLFYPLILLESNNSIILYIWISYFMLSFYRSVTGLYILKKV